MIYFPQGKWYVELAHCAAMVFAMLFVAWLFAGA